jgi:hypothetical protein
MATDLSRQDRIDKMTLENNIDASAMVAVSILIGVICFVIGSTWSFLDSTGSFVLKVVLVGIAVLYILLIGKEYNQKMEEIKDIFKN